MRAQGWGEAEAQATIRRRVGALDRELAQGMPEFADREKSGLADVAGGAEANGVFRSSKRLIDQQNFANRIGRERNRFQSGIADSKDAALEEFMRQLISMRLQGGEQAVDARQRIVIEGAQGGLYA